MDEMKFNGEIWIRIPVTKKAKDEPDEFVIVKNKKSAGGLIPYARWGKRWSATPIPLRPLLRELVLLVEKIPPPVSSIFCENCQDDVVVSELKGFQCGSCGEMICPKCGCTDSTGCAAGCGWTEKGICTECA